MKIGELFAGIGGFGLGFARAGFEHAFMVEKDEACQSVLRENFPGVPIFGDVTQVNGADLPPCDVLTFGSPCQDLSVAGKRAGFDGARSGLFFEATRIIREMRAAHGQPAIAIWENVPGAFTSARGLDFAAALDALAECGAVDLAWRVLDARYFGVAQRRRRVFLVADFGGERAGAVLFEPEGVRRDPPAGRGAGQGVAGTLGSSIAGGFRTTDLDSVGAYDVGSEPFPLGGDVAYTLQAAAGHHGHSSPRGDGSDNLVTEPITFESRYVRNGRGAPDDSGLAPVLRAESGETGKGDAAPLVLFSETQVTSGENRSNPQPGDPAHTLATDGRTLLVGGDTDELGPTCQERDWKGSGNFFNGALKGASVVKGRVRRLTPTEYARLQGFPDDWNASQKDATRYRQLGNAVAVPVAEWLARRTLQALA